MLKRDVSLAEDLTELRICAQELLSVKVKRQIGSNGYLYLELKIIVRVFPSIKLKKSPPLDCHHTIERREHRVCNDPRKSASHICAIPQKD